MKVFWQNTLVLESSIVFFLDDMAIRNRHWIIRLDRCVLSKARHFIGHKINATSFLFLIAIIFQGIGSGFQANHVAVLMAQDDKEFLFRRLPFKFVVDADYFIALKCGRINHVILSEKHGPGCHFRACLPEPLQWLLRLPRKILQKPSMRFSRSAPIPCLRVGRHLMCKGL